MSIDKILEYYMGKNTMERQEFIIKNLRFELDKVEDNNIPQEALVEEEAAV
jgi:topoisomerase-4 subunit B